MAEDELEKILDFDESDLYANRNGYLTEKQKKKLTKDEKSTKWLMWILTIVCGGLAIAPWVLLVVSKVTGELSGSISRILTSYVSIIIWSLLWGFFANIWFQSTRDKYTYKLQTVEGSVNYIHDSWDGTHGAQHHSVELHVARKKFEDFDTALVDVMVQGDEYALYYLDDSPRGRIIVSAEMEEKKK
jgi:hypothetical protein